ncbi:MAG: hypothetical protein AAFX79_03680 [Planctomycetota bacterium]
MHRTYRISLAALVATIAGTPALAQQQPAAPRPPSLPAVEDPAGMPEAVDYEQAVREMNRRRRGLEFELRKLKRTYFRNPRAQELREAGIRKLREYTDPAIFESMLEIFGRSGDDVRRAIVEHLAQLGTDEALAMVAWTAVFDKDERLRVMAAETLDDVLSGRDVPRSVQSVVAEGLRRSDNTPASAAAGLAATLRIADAIPAMIASQIAGRRNDSDGNGALAYILVGQQQAFVSDLTPVVSDSAVAFDPELSVVTEGVILRVIDAAVVQYRVEIHDALVRLTSDLYGEDTSRLGWDQDAWRQWYATDFVPHMQEQLAKADGAGDAGPG